MSNVTCFIGVLGSGKDHQSRKLVKEGYVQINFADELREMAWSILGWRPENDLEYDWFKKGQIYVPNYGEINGRIFLQNIGSTMRKKDINYWVKCWIDKASLEVNKGNKVCCSDCRFLNEIRYALRLGSNFIFCNYKSSRYDDKNTHESEHLAQRFLKEGFKDLQEIEKSYLMEIL